MKVRTVVFAFEAAAIIGLAVLGHREHDRFATLGELLDRVMASRAARIAILTFWWWLGWHFLFARTIDA